MASGSPTVTKIERAHQLYRDDKYAEALNYYTDALSVTRTKPQKIALHSNRAACYLKLHDFNKAADECTSVLELDQNHTGALMLRAQTLVTLKEYHCALFDVNRLIELNPSSEVYRNLEVRLKTQLSLATIPEDDAEREDDDECLDEAELEENEEGVEEFRTMGNETTVAASEKEKQNGSETRSSTISVASPQDKTQETARQSEWQKIPKPKGHSQLDYSRWNSVEDSSSEEEDDDDDNSADDGSQPQYRFRVKTVGVKAVNNLLNLMK